MSDLSPPDNLKLGDIAVIIGSQSRAGQSAFDEFDKQFRSDLVLLAQTKKPGEMEQAILEAKKKGAKVVAIGGGDGTLRLAAKSCIKHDLTMGMIPSGTGNALARELGVPLNPVKALEFITTDGVIRDIDVGYFNDELFLTSATCGLSAKISQQLETVNKGILGRLAYLPAVIRAVREAKPFQISIQTKYDEFKGRVHQFVATSSRTHAGPFRTTTDSENNDGLLSVYAVEASENNSLLRYGLSLIRGAHTSQPNVWCAETPTADVQLNRTRRFVLDGDRFRALTVRLRVDHHALRVFAAKE